MSLIVEALFLFGAFLVLLLLGVWVPLAIGLAGLFNLWLTSGFGSFQGMALALWGGTNSFTLTAIPLFILMAEFLLQAGLSFRVYRGLARLVKRLPGGLLQTNIVGCAIFAAITGSSVATAASIGTVGIPELLKRDYDRSLSVGTIAAGGTLGILIPPSIAMIIYGSFTNLSVAKLFMAGLLPGIVLALLFMLYVGVRALINPALAPSGDEPGEIEAGDQGVLATLNDLLPFAVLIGLVLGSLYFGYATPTESAALGCVLSAIIAWTWGDMNRAVLTRVFRRTISVSASILAIVFAAYIFSYSVSLSGLGSDVATWLGGLELSRLEFIILLFVFYTLLGCLVDSISMIVMTIPVLYPVLGVYGFDGIWFGVILVLLIELGQITPPMGLNLFVIQGVWDGRLGEIVRGVLPFYGLIILMILIVTLLPSLALWLPSHMTVR
ncbi:TRAP transporter large permease [Salinisphaera aquimarina]|uniref:TRAP transporter large permease protein n=1 Tax=Salinisphaera aquimarina TaxID=2094031 RepID=A0ABV7ELL7_9GAMM